MRLPRPGRRLLDGPWWVRAAPPADDAQPPAEGDWLETPGACTAAAALRGAGRWSLDQAARDFDGEDWWFRTRFDATPADLQGAVLGLDGLATCARAWLNGQEVAAGDNMFIAHEKEVRRLLRARGNELLIRCASLSRQLQRRRPRPRWRTPMLTQQQLRWWRTTLLGRTPGWSPSAAAVGPWKDVWLEPSGGIHPGEVRLHPSVEGESGMLRCHVEMAGPADASPMLRVSRGGRVWEERLRRGSGGFEGTIAVDRPALWWPHTHGEPCLYDVSLQLGESEFTLPRVGFRTIEADTSDDGFALRVNGERVFCRGAVWMPLDPVTLRAPPQACRGAVEQARAAGMNMLRVAGTTVYEEDHFYAACDEAGVLVWQDFMFANMDYPADDAAFAASVEAEVRQQLARLQARPCLAVLCGNSEGEQQAAMWGAPRDQWQPRFFGETLRAWCQALAPATPYWPSSAHGGSLPQQPDAGTASYYGVGAYRRSLEDARLSRLRFATECLAFANIPAASALARLPGGAAARVHHPAWKQRTPRDLGAGWDFEDVRDHYLGLLFDTDAQHLRAVDHERYLALGRVATGEAMARAFSQWRTDARCGGALVLMLRDLWAGAGWGLLDDHGAPKACWHALKRVLQPVALCLVDEGLNGLAIHVINESAAPRELRVVLQGWQGGDVRVAHGEANVLVPARGHVKMAATSLLSHFIDLNWAYRFGPAPCDAVACTLLDAGNAAIARAHHFPQGMALPQEPELGLQAQTRMLDTSTFEAVIRTRRFALGVHFDGEGFAADDEYFHLAPGEEARVKLRGQLRAGSAVRAINTRQVVPLAPLEQAA